MIYLLPNRGMPRVRAGLTPRCPACLHIAHGAAWCGHGYSQDPKDYGCPCQGAGTKLVAKRVAKS